MAIKGTTRYMVKVGMTRLKIVIMKLMKQTEYMVVLAMITLLEEHQVMVLPTIFMEKLALTILM
jgi:hypothetical protein